MKQPRSSIDGFIPRRAGAELGDLHEREQATPIDRTLHTGASDVRSLVGQPREGAELTGRSDIAESLKQIDDEPMPQKDKKLSRRQHKALKRQNRTHAPTSRTKRIIKWLLILLLIAGIGLGGFVAYRAFIASGNIFEGNFFDVLQNEPLKKDANGRSNFLVFGTAEDSEGGTHQGGNLTDSIMVISVDQDKKTPILSVCHATCGCAIRRPAWLATKES